MTEVRKPALALLGALDVFANLPEADYRVLADVAKPCRFGRGETIYGEGETAARCLLIESGRLSLVCYSERGELYLRRQFASGQLVALPVMFMKHGRYPATARADAPLYGYWLGRDALEAMCLASPAAALAVLRYTSGMLSDSLRTNYSLATTACAERLARHLIEADARALASPEAPAPLSMNIGELAANLGMRSETLSRVLAKWRKLGLISGRGNRLTVLDPTGIRNLCG